MTFKVFISSSARDKNIVNELKDTLNRYGIVSILFSEVTANAPYSQSLRDQIQSSDCVLAIISAESADIDNVGYEIGLADSLNRPVIPIVEEGVAIPTFLFGKEYILIDRDQPKLSYQRAADYLNKLKLEKEQRNAIGGVLLLGLGLLLLGALFSSD